MPIAITPLFSLLMPMPLSSLFLHYAAAIIFAAISPRHYFSPLFHFHYFILMLIIFIIFFHFATLSCPFSFSPFSLFISISLRHFRCFR
jgi:hypothetical protein